MKEIEKLFSKPLASTRSGALYNSFPYPTKISPETIAVYIATTTLPGDSVLDAFSGSGSTGIAALLSEHPTERMISTAKELGVEPVWGRRNAVLYEIGTYAAFATKTITNRLTSKEYCTLVDGFIKKAKDVIGEMYSAKSPDGKAGVIRYSIWTEVLICPKCGGEINYFSYGTSKKPVEFKDYIECPHCKKTCAVDDMAFKTENYYDKLLKKIISRKKRKLAWIYGTTEGVNWDRAANADDEELIQKIEDQFVPCNDLREIEWGDLHRTGYHYGITHLHHFYTTRNYRVMSELWRLAETYPEREADALKLLLLSYNGSHSTLMTRVVAKHGAKDFVLTSAQSGVLYISKLPVEKNILLGLSRKKKSFEEAYKLLENCHGTVTVRNSSSTKMIEQNCSVDFVFTDPPFGDFIPYAEVNQINELWLSKTTDREEEIIISDAQNKGVDKYRKMLAEVFREINRVTKDNSPIAVVFHAAKATVWAAFSEAIKEAGLEIQQSSFLDKTQASFKQVVSRASVQGDPLFLLNKIKTKKKPSITEDQILRQVIKENAHKTELDQRHCYSLFIGKCMENGITVQKDATQVYELIQRIMEGELS